MESELDNLRKELASTDGGIFPHSVLSTQQISILCSQKPETTQQLEKIIGKLKTQKYGDKILEVIGKHEGDEVQVGHDEEEEEEEEKTSVKRSAKRSRNKKVVVIESSEDEE